MIHILVYKHGLRSLYKTMFSKWSKKWLRDMNLGFADDKVLQINLWPCCNDLSV